ncbi:MAG: OmpP1/FadL family transporter [Bacteroidia bacterium]
MKRIILTLGMGLFCTLAATSQNEVDAMRYSQLTFGGTARFASMAGSMGALGGDISTLSFNPAGIAIFKKTELSITPSVFSQTTTSTYNGETSDDRKLNFNLGNIGLVASFNLISDKNTSGWENVNFGFGYNRTNNFNNRIRVEADNKNSSLMDVFVADADGHSSAEFDQFSTGLAWGTYLINPVDTNGTLQYNHVAPNYGIHQVKEIETRGSMGETVISFGGNYKSKLYLGATLGIANAKYYEDSKFTESDPKDTISNFNSYTYFNELTTKGTGVNLKIGAIVRPTDWLRIGASFHSPTSFGMHDQYSSEIKSDLENWGSYDSISPQGDFDYRVITPFRTSGSLGFIINKIALLNVEYEYVDYSYAQLRAPHSVFSDVNSSIRKNYTSTGNLRAGAEVRFDPIAIRAGYALYGSPFLSGENVNAARSSYTAGIGYRQDHYFVDFAYVLTKYSEYSYLYSHKNATPVKNDFRSSSFMLTAGVRF